MKSKKIVDNVDKSTGEVLPRIKTPLNAHLYPHDHEKNEQPSMTVPNQSMTVLEMIQRHRKGLPIDQSRGALYQGEELIPDISNMDLVDRHAYMDSVADALVEVKNRIKANAKSEEEKAFVARVEEEITRRLANITPEQKKIES